MKLFISYRRGDCRREAAAIYFGLRALMPDSEVFFDVDSVPVGADFLQVIRREVESADLVLVLIGDDWMSLSGPDGKARIGNPADYVHTEVQLALAGEVPVVPVLVEGAVMPAPHELPEPLRPLALRNAFEVRNETIATDIGRLSAAVAALDQSAGTRVGSSGHVPPSAGLGPTASIQPRVLDPSDEIARVMPEVVQGLVQEDRRLGERGQYVLEKHLARAVAAVLPDARTEASFEVPGWDPQPGRFDVVMGGRGERPPRIAIETKLKDHNGLFESLWDCLKLLSLATQDEVEAVYLIGGTTQRLWNKPIESAELYETGERDLVQMIRDVGEWWTNYILGDSVGRPFACPTSLHCELVAAIPVTIRGGEWEIRAVRLEAARDWEPFDEGSPRAGPIHNAVESSPTRESTLVIPARITARWLADHCPGMSADEFATLVQAMRDRRWSDGWIIDYAFPHLDARVCPRLRKALGSPERARDLAIPSRMTIPWAERTVPGLNGDEVAAVAKEAEDRGWTLGEVEDFILVMADPGCVEPQTF